jgi:hypothetical protein
MKRGDNPSGFCGEGEAYWKPALARGV